MSTNETAVDFLRGNALSETWRICEGLARSTLLPKEFVGKPENVMISVMVSNRLKIDPFTVMQNISVINGRPMFSTQFLIALTNNSGIFSEPIDWEVSGEGNQLTVVAYAKLRSTGKVVSEIASMQQAQDEGWTRNPKYKTMPVRMLKYRSASALIGLYAPQIKMGFSTEEEVETIDAEPAAIEKPSPQPVTELAEKIGTPRRGRPTKKEIPIAEAPTEDVSVDAKKKALQSDLAKIAGEIYAAKQAGNTEEAAGLESLIKTKKEELASLSTQPEIGF